MSHITLLFYIQAIIIYSYSSLAQTNKDYAQWWLKIELASDDEKPFKSDTMVVMQTTRQIIHSEKGKAFFNHTSAPNNKLTTLLAVCKNQYWKIFIMSDIDEAMKMMPLKKDLVFYIEGLGKNFPIAMYRAAGLTTQYDVNVIMFDYPTVNESIGLIRNFYFAEKSSKKSADTFAEFLKTLQDFEKQKSPWILNKNKTLFIHSLGNVMLKEAVVKNLLKDLQPQFLNRLVLNAACVKQHKHVKWIDSIHFASEKFIHYNKKDIQLLGARLLKHQLMLGALPKKPFSTKTYYIDFVSILGKQHNGYLNNPGISNVPFYSHKYYHSLLHGEDIPFSNETLFENISTPFRRNYRLKRNNNSL